MKYLYASILDRALICIPLLVFSVISVCILVASFVKKERNLGVIIRLSVISLVALLMLVPLLINTGRKTYDLVVKDTQELLAKVTSVDSDNMTQWLIIRNKKFEIPEELYIFSQVRAGDEIQITYFKASRFIIAIDVIKN